ncbi:MAG: 4Fe-4S dicluster domain-containing protein [Candidatus Freyarchaeota archaeon]
MSENRERYNFFRLDSCTECGVCLSKCPVMRLSPPRAKQEIRRLINGEKTTSCGSAPLASPATPTALRTRIHTS